MLTKAIEGKKTAHAYLFCGPRGVGKTSCARILAKSLNCTKGPTLKPCGECAACKEIAGGNSFDVLEIDGASNRGIDEIRTLRENVKFAPSYGRFKIYIVDEVHMLTAEAFNALLKTLEEPPDHVKFIFATTDVNKLPATIVSRCQRFDFKRVPVKTIVSLLTDLCKKEKLTVDNEALFAIGKAAQGSLRDALSILDQLSAISDRQIEATDVFSMLGKVETQLLFNLTDALAAKDCPSALRIFDEIINQGKDIKQLSKDLTEHLRNLMVIKVGGKALGKLVDYPVEVKEMLLTQSEKFNLVDILKAIDLMIEAQEVSRIMESLRMPIEIAFAKLTYRTEGATASKPAVQSAPAKPVYREEPPPLVPAPKPAAATLLKSQKGEAVLIREEEAKPELEAAVQETPEAGPIDLEKIKRLWNSITYTISRERMSVATYLQEAAPCEFTGNKLVVGFAKQFIFHKEALEDAAVKMFVEKIFAEKLRTKITIEFRIIEDLKVAADEEPILKATLAAFKGKVVNKWHDE